MLVHPEMGVVAVHGRGQLTTELADWCQDRGLEAGVRLLTGPGCVSSSELPHLNPPPGGQGKTRLARHLGHQLLELRRPADAPLLILVDYTEIRTHQLRRLQPLLWEADTSHSVRVAAVGPRRRKVVDWAGARIRRRARGSHRARAAGPLRCRETGVIASCLIYGSYTCNGA